jgi:peroxiredoxin
MTAFADPPREGLLLPGFQLPRADGGTIRIRAYRGRRALALIFAHGADCVACRAYLSAALDRYADYAGEDAEVVAVVPGDRASADAMRRELALPFPVAVDEHGADLRRYGLRPGRDAAVMATDRFGEPRIWQHAGTDHALPDHLTLIAELRYLALTCSGGCTVPLWSGR